MRRSAQLLCLGILLGGCAAEVSLLADLRTDLRPGREFSSIDVRVTSPAGTQVASDASPVFTTTDLLASERVLEARGLAPGTYTLSVRLLDRDGAEVAHRDTSVSVRGTTLITVLITRDCRGVFCPSAADAPELTECLAGRCVRPECVVEDPSSCPLPTCTSSSACGARFPAACADPACISGACFATSHDDRCATGQWCDPASGCRAIDPRDLDGGLGDGGRIDAAAVDAAAADGWAADAPAIDAYREDTGGSCGPATPCDTGRVCETGHLDCSGACVADGFVAGGTECRPSSGPCDRAESCTGSTPSCPPDRSEPDGTSCGGTWRELSCGPFDVDVCQGGSCVRDPHFGSSGRPSCGALSDLCGFSPGNCCGSGGYFCVDEPGNDIYGSSTDCGQCCRPGRCCMDGNPAGPCS